MKPVPAECGNAERSDSGADFARRANAIKDALVACLIATFLSTMGLWVFLVAGSVINSQSEAVWTTLSSFFVVLAIYGIPAYLIGLLVASPVIIVVVLVSAVFADSIHRRTAEWCVGLPLVIWGVVGPAAARADILAAGSLPVMLDRYALALIEPISLFLLFGLVTGSTAYYVLSRRRITSGGKTEGRPTNS